MLEQRIIHAVRQMVTELSSNNGQDQAALPNKEAIARLRSLIAEYDRIPSAELAPVCPNCGADEIEELADAWFVRQLAGFDSSGEAMLGRAGDTRAFDDRHFECVSCGYQTSDAAEFRPAMTAQKPS